jgi:hypothetical protein
VHDMPARPGVAQIVKAEVGNIRFDQTAFPGRTDRVWCKYSNEPYDNVIRQYCG